MQFYSNNANLHHSQYAVLPRNIESTVYCDITSPYVFDHISMVTLQLADTPTRELASSRTGQLVDTVASSSS